MLPIIIIAAIAGGNTATISTIISVTSLAVSTVTSAGVLTTSAITCGAATATATIISGGIIYATHSQQKEVNNEAEQNLNQIPLNTIDTTKLLEQIPRFYPITTFVNDDEESILDSISHEQRLETLECMLNEFIKCKDNFKEFIFQKYTEITYGKHLSEKTSLEKDLKIKSSKFFLYLKLTIKKPHTLVTAELIVEQKLNELINIFNAQLQDLSQNISCYHISTPVFSLAEQIESIYVTYQASRKNNSYYLFGSNKLDSINEDIHFIKEISNHRKCHDYLRFAALEILNQRIIDFTNEIDKNLLQKINCLSNFDYSLISLDKSYKSNKFKSLLIFCLENDLHAPNHFKESLDERNKKFLNK